VCVFTGKRGWGVSAARAPVPGTFSIRFDLPPALKSGRLYIIIIIIRYAIVIIVITGVRCRGLRAFRIPKHPFLNQSALSIVVGAMTFLSLDIQ